MNDNHTNTTDQPGAQSPTSRRVIWDIGVAWFLHEKLREVLDQINIELQRNDLYPNVETSLRRKRNAINSVLKMITGNNSGKMGHPFNIEHLLIAEYPPEEDGDEGAMDFYEAENKREARILAKAAEDEGAITTSYLVIPEAGNTIMVFHPVGTDDNTPEPRVRPARRTPPRQPRQHGNTPTTNQLHTGDSTD